MREVVATGHAFAALREDGDVVTWGHIVSGGESVSIRDKLHAVQQIASSMHAFAAVRRDGTVVTWGEAESGGDSSKVKDQLERVKQATWADILCMHQGGGRMCPSYFCYSTKK